MKKFLYFSAIIVIFLIPNTSRTMSCGNYTDEEYKYIVEQSNPNDLDLTCANGTLYTDDYLNSIKRTTDEYSINPLKISDFLNVPHFTRERYYWCGPANIKQVLHYLNKSSLSQYQYSLDADTERYQETWVYKVVETLNKYLL